MIGRAVGFGTEAGLFDERRERDPREWTAAAAGLAGVSDDEEYEYQPLRIDPSMSRGAAATMLAVRAEFSGWELARTLRFTDGSRTVWLRRKRSRHMLPGLIV